MIIIGILGFIGAGKDTVADYLVEKFGFHKLTMSDIIKEEMKRLGVEPNRTSMQDLSVKYKAEHGKGVWARKSVEFSRQKGWERVVIVGLRDNQEVSELKKAEEFVLLFVDADLDIRLKRLAARGSEKDTKSRQELISQEKRELELFDLLRDYKKYYDYKVTNNSTHVDLWREIDKFAAKYKLSK